MPDNQKSQNKPDVHDQPKSEPTKTSNKQKPQARKLQPSAQIQSTIEKRPPVFMLELSNFQLKALGRSANQDDLDYAVSQNYTISSISPSTTHHEMITVILVDTNQQLGKQAP